MAIIKIYWINREVQSSPAISVLNALMRDGVPIQHKCGGKAQCGTCRIKIVEGERFLNPVGERERTRLDAIGNPADIRLACQTHAFRDITIEIALDLLKPTQKGN